MRKIPSHLWDVAEKAAVEGFKALSAAMSYEGDNAKYDRHARHGAVAVSGFTRMLASQNNSSQIVLTAVRLESKGIKGGAAAIESFESTGS